MARIVRLTESDLTRLVRRVINEQNTDERKQWHTFAALRDTLTSKGFKEDKMMEKYGVLSLNKGEVTDQNGIWINCKPTTGEWGWGVNKNSKPLVEKKYQINLKNTNTIGAEGKKVYDMIMKDITPYLNMKFGPLRNQG